MTPRHLLLALAILALPTTLPAAPVQLPCKLPAQGGWQMTNERHGWSRDGKPWTVTATQSVRIDRAVSGIRLTLGTISTTSDLTGAARQRLIAAFGPNSQQPIILWLAEDGRIIAIEDLDRHWQANLAMVEQVARDTEAAGQSGARARAALAALGEADEPTRIGMIAASIGPFLHHCGQAVDADRSDGLIIVQADSDSPQLRENTIYRIDGATGLARDIARRVTVKAQPDKPQIDHWRFDPLPATTGERP